MTDPTPDSSESAAKQDEQFNFNWWVTMLPFLGAICWFIFQWSHDRGNMTWAHARGAVEDAYNRACQIRKSRGVREKSHV